MEISIFCLYFLKFTLKRVYELSLFLNFTSICVDQLHFLDDFRWSTVFSMFVNFHFCETFCLFSHEDFHLLLFNRQNSDILPAELDVQILAIFILKYVLLLTIF